MFAPSTAIYTHGPVLMTIAATSIFKDANVAKHLSYLLDKYVVATAVTVSFKAMFPIYVSTLTLFWSFG